MSLDFYGASRGVNYSVETSVDLETWLTSGVTPSDPEFLTGVRTAQIERDIPHSQMALSVRRNRPAAVFFFTTRWPFRDFPQ